MPRTLKSATLAFCLAVLSGAGLTLAFADETFDVTQLPRVSGAKVIYAGPTSTIYTTSASIAQSTESVRGLLKTEGWQEYVRPFASSSDDPTNQILSFKNGWRGLTVFISQAPAERNATSVSYSPNALETDLPFPKEATDIAFDPARPYLKCTTPGSVAALVDFFSGELSKLGWQRNTAKGDATDKGAHVFFTRESQRPLLLTVRQTGAGKNEVTLESVPVEVMAGKTEAAAEPEAAGPEPKAADAGNGAAKTPADEIGDEIMKEVQKEVGGITKDALLGAKPKSGASASDANAKTSKPLAALAGDNAPIPLPEGAEDIDHDGAGGKLEFTTKSSVSAVAAFYRASMKPLGWKETPSVINRLNMSVLAFTKGNEKVSLTIMQMGAKTNVSASGSVLETAKASSKQPASSETAEQSTPPSAEDLQPEDNNGLPIPKRHTLSGFEKSAFRRELTASVPISLDLVLGFYRRELPARGWKEEADGAVVKADEAVLKFSSSEGPGTLKLGRKGGETTVSFSTRNPGEAAKSGLMPKAGQVKLLFGNMLEKGAELTINKKTIKVAAGTGAKGGPPDGPTLELAPGKYTYRLKSPGQPAQSEEIEVAADEIWGMVIGPGGVLPIQMY